MAGDPFTHEDRLALCAGAAAVAASGAVVASAGNLSVRRDGALLITNRGARLARVTPEDCVCVDLATGAVDPAHTAPTEPSSEAALHRAVYAAVPSAAAVVHTHSHFATVLSTLVEEVPAVHYATGAFGGPVRVAPYATFGSPTLAGHVADALAGRTAALMANHGAVATGSSVEHAVEQALQLEWLASVAWHALAAGSPALLGADDLAAAADQRAALRYGEAA